MSLSARSNPAHLRGADFDVDLGAGAFSLRTTADHMNLALDAPMASLTAGGLTANRARLQLRGQAPYPDLKRRRADGPVMLGAGLIGGQLAFRGQSLNGAQILSSFQG